MIPNITVWTYKENIFFPRSWECTLKAFFFELVPITTNLFLWRYGAMKRYNEVYMGAPVDLQNILIWFKGVPLQTGECCILCSFNWTYDITLELSDPSRIWYISDANGKEFPHRHIIKRFSALRYWVPEKCNNPKL